MRIAAVLGYLAPRYGGPPNFAANLGLMLGKYGAENSWWATATDDEQEELAFLGENAHLFNARFPRSWFRAPQLIKELGDVIGDIDLLHLHQIWDYPIFSAARLAIERGKPYVVTPHGIFAQPWRYSSPKKRLYLKCMAMPFLRRAACLHAVSPAEIKGFQNLGIKVPYTVIPNGVRLEEFFHLPEHDEAERIWPSLSGRLVVLFLGRLSPEKGLNPLVSSWSSVLRKCPRAILILAGPDYKGHKASVARLIKKYGLGETIMMPGLLCGEKKKAVLGRADIYVQPSFSEGFSSSILEALACAKPCVITPGCNFPEVAEVGAGEVVKPVSGLLSSSIIKLLSMTHQERQAMGEKGRKLVQEKYTWDIAARKMLMVYRCILDKEPIPLIPEPVPIP